MTFQLTTTQGLKSFAGAAIFGLSMDAASLVSCHLSEALWFALREVVGVLFWGALAGVQATHTSVLGQTLIFVDCPLQVLHSLGALVHFLGSAV